MSTIYLDVCCLNRPTDDQSQDRIRLEAAAVVLILKHVDDGEWRWIPSQAVAAEMAQAPDAQRRQRVEALVEKANVSLLAGLEDRERARELVDMGFTAYDAAHLAFAERGEVDVLLTTDDKFLKRAKRETARLHVTVENPLLWLNTRGNAT